MAYKKAAGTEYIPKNTAIHVKKKSTKKIVASRKPGWLLRVTPGMGIIALIFLIGMSFVAQHVWLNFLGFQITEMKKEISEIQANNEKLKFKIANFGSLDKIEEVAVNQLGMIYPGDHSVHYIFPEGAQEDNVEATQRLAEFVTSPVVTDQKEIIRNNTFSNKAWLGAVQDFFYHWLIEDRNS